MLRRINLHLASGKRSHFSLRPVLALARWRLRSHRLFLLFIAASITAIVTLVCTVPLYSYATTTAGLHATINTDAESSFIVTDAQLDALSPTIVKVVDKWVNDYPSQNMKSYLTSSRQMVSEVYGPVKGVTLPGQTSLDATLLGYSIPYASQHVQLIQGRLPAKQSAQLEIAISDATAQRVGLTIGSTMSVPMIVQTFNSQDIWQEEPSTLRSTPIPLSFTGRVVGIYQATNANDGFWHGFDPRPKAVSQNGTTIISITALASQETLLDQFYQTITRTKKEVVFPGERHRSLLRLHWFHQLNAQQIEVAQINDLMARLDTWQEHSMSNISDGNTPPPIYRFGETVQTQMRGATLGLSRESILNSYKAQADVVSLPSNILLLEMAALGVLFIIIMTTLLVERQSETIALLRSRGATRWQIFASFSAQGILLVLPALVLGPLLAWLVTDWLVRSILHETRLEAVQLLARNPSPHIQSLLPYAAVAAGSILIAMIVTLWNATGSNILMLRRERSRTQKRPLWQRLNLDLFAALLALLGYAIAFYVTNTQINNIHAQLFAITPLTLIAPLFLAIAAMLLLLRFFPALLRLIAAGVSRWRGATATLALEQTARTPQAPLRLTLLLALTCGFLLFSQIFLSTQTQRLSDLATYETGAMFSGTLRYQQSGNPTPTENALQEMKGVEAVSAGCVTTTVVSPPNQSFSQRVEVRAVNADTFGNVAKWTSQDDPVQINQQLQRLASQREYAIKANVVPALVDNVLWNSLKLKTGDRFVMHNNTASNKKDAFVTLIAIGRINHIPTLHHTVKLENASALPTGMLVDFRTYAAAYQRLFKQAPLTINYAWLRTQDSPEAIASVRSMLTEEKSPLAFDSVFDYTQFLEQEQQSPLYLLLSGQLLLGTLLLLLFALVGCLATSWQSMRQRLTNFAVLRALGTSPQQVIAIMSWEQAICYLFALLLGSGLAILLATTVIPFLIFSTVPIQIGLGDSSDSTNTFYIMQRLFPVHLSVPPSLVTVLALLLLFTCCTLLLMIWQSSRLILSQALRVSED